ncbi:hypothetical protein BGX34_010828 [Mortierella sp. NVP85]|nr:hypothetical protein BGX34_010828 [Mortierella sp. NVP85]
MVRVLTSIFNCDGGTDHPNNEGSSPNLLAIVVSPTSEAHVKVMLAQPFQMDLLDRVRLAHIQVENASPELQRVLIVDDSWARLKARNSPVLTWRSTEAHKEHYALSLTHECHRLVSLLACITASSKQPLGPLQAVCVLDQSECERYGVPSGIGGKVIFLITKDREERPRSVALRTCIHWIDRMFQRSGYTLEWTHANVIPLYVELPGSAALNLAGQREESVYAGVGIQLSGKRPLEACARIKVREGKGGEVLEASVLEEVERTKMFEAQVIPRLHFEELMGNMSLECEAARSDKDQDEASSDDMEDDNPFL